MELLEFYPTPRTLLEKILNKVRWNHIGSVLEPSAGKGDIVNYIKEAANSYPYHNSSLDVDCIEKNADLQNMLKGAGLRLVHDDFLSYRTYKSYDLIIMNPPFSNGDAHLSKALDMQEKTGGDVICILNAETLRNPWTNSRKALLKRLEDAGAFIEYMKGEFESAERTTSVEIAVVKVHYEKPECVSGILDGLKKKYYSEGIYEENITDLAPKDFIETLVKAYELEVEAGIKLINEYRALKPRLLNDIRKDEKKHARPMLELKSGADEASVNDFVKDMRMKYWNLLFADTRITGQMTQELKEEFHSKVKKLADYEFSIYNIKQLQIKMTENLVSGIEKCIISLFDEFSHKYSYYDTSTNIHFYNGWKTNKSWIINKKVIIPIYHAFDEYSMKFTPTDYRVMQKLSDIEKALNYLDNGNSTSSSIKLVMENAKETGETKNIRCKFFDITFYKKGTCHIVFRDEELLKKFNIFGSQRKGWLPPSYGKKTYSEMTAEEKAVINEFEGEASYNKTMCNKDYYLFSIGNMMMIEEKSA